MDKDRELVPISENMINDLLKRGLRELGLSQERIVEVMAMTKVDGDMIDRISIDLYVGSEVKFIFKNVVIFRDASGVQVVPREQYGGYWLKKYSFGVDYVDGVVNCVFGRFVLNAVGEENYQLARLLIGYVLAQENNSFRGRALLLMDSNTMDDDNNNANGGTGKGLFCKGLECMLSGVKMDGKRSSSGQFDMQNVREDTRLIIVNDIKRNFNFERLYNAITDGLEVEHKHKEPFVLHPGFGYKFIITSNYLIGLRGESDRRRRLELLFSGYYNSARTPFDEFGELFNWNDGEWSRFYSWMVACLKEYLEKGFNYLVNLNNEVNHLLHRVSRVGDVSIYRWVLVKLEDEWRHQDKLAIREMYQQYLLENDLSERDVDIKWFSRRVRPLMEENGYVMGSFRFGDRVARGYIRQNDAQLQVQQNHDDDDIGIIESKDNELPF
jgi:hypothetical protein